MIVNRTDATAAAEFTADPAAAALEAARALAPEIRERAREGEQLRTMPPDLADRIEAAGLFALWLPRSWWLELDPATTTGSSKSSVTRTALPARRPQRPEHRIFAWLEPTSLRTIPGDPRRIDEHDRPAGSAMPDDKSGYTVSGRWAFNTGVCHARFSQLAAVVLDAHGATRRNEGGSPEWRMAYLPPTGTGSSTPGTALACAAVVAMTWSSTGAGAG